MHFQQQAASVNPYQTGATVGVVWYIAHINPLRRFDPDRTEGS